MINVFRITIPVNDIERSVYFYSHVLEIGGIRVAPGRHYFDCGGVIVSCYDAVANGDAVVPRTNEEYIYFAVDDIDAALDRARAAGAPLDETVLPGVGALGRVETRPWGERSFYTRDPSGNPLCFAARDSLFTSGTLNP